MRLWLREIILLLFTCCVVGTDDPRRLELGSFFYSDTTQVRNAETVLLYESLREKKVEYVLGNYYAVVERKEGARANPVDEIHRWVSMLAIDLDQELSRTKELEAKEALASELSQGMVEWRTFQLYAQKMSLPTYSMFLQENKFRAGLYVERENVNREIDLFLGSTTRGLILVAESGLGKTNLLCRWEQKLLQQQHATVFFYGRITMGRDRRFDHYSTPAGEC